MMRQVEQALTSARAAAALAATQAERARVLASFALVVAEAAVARQPQLHTSALDQAQAAFTEALQCT
jgi:hypothetical protein